MNVELLIVIFFLIIVLVSIPAILIFISIQHKRYNEKSTKYLDEHRFEYLDTFYYQYIDGDNTITNVFNIVMDLNNTTIYAIPESSFKECSYKIEDNNFELFSNNKKISLGDKGSFYLDKEYEAYKKEKGKLILLDKKVVYKKEKISKIYKRAPFNLYNINPQYDIELLDKAIFVYGSAMFD